MTRPPRVERRQQGEPPPGRSHRLSPSVVAWSAVVMIIQVLLPAPAEAWWGKLEKLSGPGDFWGPVFEFRVACFGDVSREAAHARSLTTGVPTTQKTGEAESAWLQALGLGGTDVNQTGRTPEERVRFLEKLHDARSLATSASGVDWTLCSPLEERRFAVDVAWSGLRTGGSPAYTGSPIRLDMLMASVSLRVFPRTSWDVLDISAGAGPYWFTSAPAEHASPEPNPDGIPALNGFVVQPFRFILHAPSDWSSRPTPEGGNVAWTVLRRLLSVPSVGWGLTRFPSGFEPGDFGAGGSAARRIPAEWLSTLYFSGNIQPLLELLK